MLVAIGLFAIVMTVCVDVLLALVNANRKAQALELVMDNLNIALDGMVRAIREGDYYHCGNPDFINTLSPEDCSSTTDSPANHYVLAFEPYGQTASGQPWVYSYDPSTKAIYRSENGGAPLAITGQGVTIDDMEFYVIGSTPGDTVQPKVMIVIKGSAGVPGSSSLTTFHIQATAVQRVLDL